jgi:hypothetical protein
MVNLCYHKLSNCMEALHGKQFKISKGARAPEG